MEYWEVVTMDSGFSVSKDFSGNEGEGSVQPRIGKAER